MAAKRILITLIMFLLMLPAWPASVRRVERTRTARQKPSAQPAATETPEQGDGVSFESFALITQRNIFDPTRQPYRASSAAGRTSDTTPVADTIDLLGVLIDSGKSVAFTDGSNADYKQSLAPGGTIAGMKVVAISTDGLQMEADSRRIDWPVGKRLVRREGQGWEIADSPRFAASSETPRQSLAQTRPSGNDNRGGNPFLMNQMNQNRGGNPDNNSDSRRRNRDNTGQAASNQQRGSTPAQASSSRGSGASSEEIMARLRERRRREMGQ